MADVPLTVEEITRDGLTATYTGIATGNTYQVPNDGKTFLHFKKDNTGVATITVTTPNTVDGLAIADKTLAMTGSTSSPPEVLAGPYPREHYNDGSGNVEFSTSNGNGLTCAVVRLP